MTPGVPAARENKLWGSAEAGELLRNFRIRGSATSTKTVGTRCTDNDDFSDSSCRPGQKFSLSYAFLIFDERWVRDLIDAPRN